MNATLASLSTAPLPEELAPTLDPADPMACARIFLTLTDVTDESAGLIHHCGQFYRWDGAAYRHLDNDTVRAAVWRFLEGAKVKGDGGLAPFRPNRNKVANVLDALQALVNLPNTVTPPAWLDEAPADCPPAREILPCQNGLLHLPTLRLLLSTPAFFSLNALDFAYDPQAPAPAGWLTFLHQLWPDDPASIDTLQEIAGYLLTPDTSQQKIFLMVGPMRSGKGTVARVLTRLLGQDNVCGPTLAGLGQNFGLAPLIGKQLAVIADARLSGRADQHAIAERLLSISGEDGITVDRKFLPAWTGRLPTRFLILTNELPRLADTSGALANRFIVLTLTESFYGREDPGLTDRLLRELPAILNWAIAGWRRLRERGHFVQPQSAADAIDELRDLASPVGAFVRERCIVGAHLSVRCALLFDEWRNWCQQQGRDHPGTVQSFGRDLRAVVPGLKTGQPRDGYDRSRHYYGIGLRNEDWDDE